MASLLHGAGLRLSECASLRVKDVDFAVAQLVVRSGKAQRDRVALLPKSLVEPLLAQLQQVRRQQMPIWRGARAIVDFEALFAVRGERGEPASDQENVAIAIDWRFPLELA